MPHVGMDTHKRFSAVTVVDEGGNEILAGRRLDNQAEEIAKFIGSLDDERIQVVLEAGQNRQWMYDLLDEMGFDSRLFHPLKTRATASARIKTDKIDPGTLAHLSRMDFVPEACKADVETRRLREALRYRAAPVKTRSSLKNGVRAILAGLNIPDP